MKKLILSSLCFFILLQAGFADSSHKSSKFDFTGPKNPSLIRGFNYTPANVTAPRHHIDCWVYYDSTTIEFDLDLAKSLNLNQVRIFIPYTAYNEDKNGFSAKLKHFVRACHKRSIGVMPVVGYGPWLRDTTQYPLAREWAQLLIDAISDEPGLAI